MALTIDPTQGATFFQPFQHHAPPFIGGVAAAPVLAGFALASVKHAQPALQNGIEHCGMEWFDEPQPDPERSTLLHNRRP